MRRSGSSGSYGVSVCYYDGSSTSFYSLVNSSGERQFPPLDHRTTATTYGIGTNTYYGHVKLSDNYTSSAGAASAGVGASSTAVYNCYSNRAPISHASSATTYGVGTTSNYGHVKTINNLTTTSFSNGEALSAYQGYLVKKYYDSVILDVSYSSSGYTHCNVYTYAYSGIMNFLLNFGSGETYIVFFDQTNQYYYNSTSLTNDNVYYTKICSGMGNYSSTTNLTSIYASIQSYDSSSTRYYIRFKFNFSGSTSFRIIGLRGFGNTDATYNTITTSWASS